MAAKTANVLARVEPDIKDQAESILAQLGIPASVLINMLYKQIIITKGIPFSVSLLPRPLSRDEMGDAAFHAIMQRGYEQAKAGLSRPMEEVFAELEQGLSE